MPMYHTTEPLFGDSENILLGKWAQQVGAIPATGDSDANLLLKILVALGGSYANADSEYILLRKILLQLGGLPQLGDTINRLLQKIVVAYGGITYPDDSNNVLLAKVLRNQDPLAGFVARAGLTDAGQIAAVQALFDAAHTNGWWSKCDLIYPFVGGTAQAHSQNLKSSGFPISWFGGVTHSVNGITGGASGYGATGYRPLTSGQMLVNSAHLGIYRRTFGNDAVYCGVGVSGSVLTVGRPAFFTTALTLAINDANSVDAVTNTSLGLLAAVRNDASTKHVFNAGTDKVVNRVSSSLPPATRQLLVLAWDNNGVVSSFQTANLAGLTAGSGLTLAEFVAMNADWQAFQTALGRQV